MLGCYIHILEALGVLNALIEYAYITFSPLDLHGYHVEGARLACTIRSQKAKNLLFRVQVKGNVLDGLDISRVGLAEISGL